MSESPLIVNEVLLRFLIGGGEFVFPRGCCAATSVQELILRLSMFFYFLHWKLNLRVVFVSSQSAVSFIFTRGTVLTRLHLLTLPEFASVSVRTFFAWNRRLRHSLREIRRFSTSSPALTCALSYFVTWSWLSLLGWEWLATSLIERLWTVGGWLYIDIVVRLNFISLGLYSFCVLIVYPYSQVVWLLLFVVVSWAPLFQFRLTFFIV